MAIKLSALPAATTLTGTDILPVVSSGVTKKITLTNFNTVLGSTFQPVDAELTAIAGVTAAADKVPYFNSTTTAALATFTSTGRALVGAASVSEQRALLDVFPPTARAALSTTTNVIAYSAGVKQSATMAGAATISSITGGSDGATLELWVKGHASVDYVLKVVAGLTVGSDSLLDMVTLGKTITANKIWILTFKYFQFASSPSWRLVSMVGGF